VTSSPYVELNISLKKVDKDSVIELSVKQENLYKTFYHFSIEIAQQILNLGITARVAIERSLGNWAQLIVQRKLMQETEQIGLAGELCFLSALIAGQGPDAFSSWLGPVKEPHDFRLDTNEIEIKSTKQSRRIHRIHGLGQLEPSSGMQLYLLSLQFEPAGNSIAGKSLVDRIEDIRRQLSKTEDLLKKFEAYIKKLGYEDSDASFYREKLKFRNLPMLVPITTSFPRITRSMIDHMLPNGTAQRVIQVEYELDVEGLGYLEGSADFDQILNGIAKLENSNG
jgi:hypothetical protein